MELDQIIEPGMQAEETFFVREQDAASHVGSGSLRVLATPSMIAYMERVARAFMDKVLPESFSSVGVHVDVQHLAATPVGSSLRVYCEVIGVAGQRVDFHVEAWDEVEKVGEGRHKRVVIEKDRFLERVQAKAKTER